MSIEAIIEEVETLEQESKATFDIAVDIIENMKDRGHKTATKVIDGLRNKKTSSTN